MVPSNQNRLENEMWKHNVHRRVWRVEVFFLVALSLLWMSYQYMLIEIDVRVAKVDQRITQIMLENNKDMKVIEEELEGLKKVVELFDNKQMKTDKSILKPSSKLDSKSRRTNHIHFEELSKTTRKSRKEHTLKSRQQREVRERNLQVDKPITSCNGTLFRLDLELDSGPSETSWELIDENTKRVVAHRTYDNKHKDNAFSYEVCIEPGPYRFSLFDSKGNGIDCGNDSCYNISIDSEPVINGQTFQGEIVTHTFDSSLLCVTNSIFEIKDDLNSLQVDTFFHLQKSSSGELIELKPSSSSARVVNSPSSYFACLPPGIYTITISDTNRDQLLCGDKHNCYTAFVNNDFLFQRSDFSDDLTYDFFVSESGSAGEQQCNKLRILSPLNDINNFEYDERVEQILSVIRALSSTDSLSRFTSPQYKAACWVLYEDTFVTLQNIDDLLERYVLAIFLFATDQSAEVFFSSDTCKHNGISCDEKGHITKIDWSKHGIRGTIPSELSYLRQLESLKLSMNKLHGSIPPELGRLRNLKQLDLFSNRLTGTLPWEIGRLSNLELLSLHENVLKGIVPSEIGRCMKLKNLSLNLNNIEGFIPSELFNCKHLRTIDLGDNRLNGTIPTNIGQIRAIEKIYLRNNMLSGRIPLDISSLSSVRWIDVENNELTGPLPNGITQLTSLEILLIHQNKFSGTFPNNLESLTGLVELDISNNEFTGSIPDSLWGLPSISQLELQNNDFHGKVPDHFCSDDLWKFEVDDSSWFLDAPKVECSCCSVIPSCYVWNTEEITSGGTVRPSCPSSNIVNIEFYSGYWVADLLANVVLSKNPGQNFYDANICMSPSGCYQIQYVVDETGNRESSDLSYSNSLKSLVEQRNCEAVEICQNLFDPIHPKRVMLNHITQFAAPDLRVLDNPSSPVHKALCWMMTQDSLVDNYEICDGTLLQRFVLALFYYSQIDAFSFDEFSFQHTCDWPGITCDSENRYVEHIELTRKGLYGTLITEIGLLTRLQTINLSENKLSGFLSSSMFSYLPDLQVFRIEQNEFGGQLPNTLFKLPKLQELNLSQNLFVGTLPDNIEYSKMLESFDVSSNLLQGEFPQSLIACFNLGLIDFSRNSFNGMIPSEIGSLKGLHVVKLNENRLSGSIPFQIFKSSQIQELMLQSNALTGSIPAAIAALTSATFIALNHNLLEGSIPIELENLQALEFLHLHQNQLTGTAPTMKFSTFNIHNYIADCGEPSFRLPSALKCTSCTICCNSNKLCQENIVWKLPIWGTGFLTAWMVPIFILVLAFCHIIIHKHCISSLSNDRNMIALYNHDSVYCFIFSKSRMARFLYIITMIIQASFFIVFLQASSFDNADADWQYSIRCPNNTTECEDENSISPFGWFLFAVVTVLFLAVDFINSVLQLHRSVSLLDMELFLSGFMLFGLTTLAAFTSGVYNVALAESNTDLIVNAVILLFINDLDEKFLSGLESLVPNWTNRCLEEIQTNLSEKDGNHSSSRSLQSQVVH